MSKAALSDLINQLETSIMTDRGKKGDEQDIKVFRRSDTNRYANAFRFRKSEFASQVLVQLKESRIQLGPLDVVRVKSVCNKYADMIIAMIYDRGSKSDKFEVHLEPDGVTLVSWVRRDLSSFDALTQQTTGTKAKLRNEVLQPFMKELNELLVKLKRGKLNESFTSNFELGHEEGSNVQYFIADRLQRSLQGTVGGDEALREQVLQDIDAALSNTRHVATAEQTRSIILDADAKFHNKNVSDLKKIITIGIESKLANAKKEEDRGVREELIKELGKFVRTRPAEEWVNQEASDSIVRAISKTVMQEALKTGASVSDRALLQPINTTPSKSSKKIIRKRKIKVPTQAMRVKLKPSPALKRKPPTADVSYISLMNFINKRLPEQVRSNMVAPRLRNRTGRFAESTRVVDVTPTAQGFPSIGYTYQKAPYDIFDRQKGRQPWNKPGRDPKALVDLSVRQLATQAGISRFYTRRV